MSKRRMPSAGRLVCRIDCTRRRGPARYFESARTCVVGRGSGGYRQAGQAKEARFGYRFDVQSPGRPHVLIVRYPDDKPRFMCLMDGSTYDLSTGAFSGGDIPASGAMREIRLVFWPRWVQNTIVFMTWQEGQPAAVRSVEVRELAALPPARQAYAPGGREFGMAFEDPCGMGLSMGASSRRQWVSRVAEFMQHSGQSLLVYPVAWYHGPQFPSQHEPADAFEMAVAEDRRMYGRYTLQPPDWVAPLLEEFSRRGLAFLAEVRFFRLGSLMQRMNIDLPSILAGADTINNMLWNNQVQSGTMDWTVVYNARNYPQMLARGLSVHVHEYKGFPFAYGEKCWADVGGGYPSTLVPPGPIFNPLHPIVQQAAVRFAREIGRRYGRFDAFGGVALGLWSETFLWYGSLRRGYDDCTIRQFQQDTGTSIPVPDDAPDRFSRRYEFLTVHRREPWIAWRCRRIADLLLAIRDALREGGRHLRLVLTPNAGNVAWAQQDTGTPPYVLLREAGFDASLLADEDGVEIDMTAEGAAGLHGQRTPQAAVDATATGACIADTWVESWGRNRMFACDADDANAERLAEIGGSKAGVYRFTCEYPPDGFWYKDQWRISTPFPAGDHYLAPMAAALADADLLRMTRGGLYPDTAHADLQRRFAKVFCRLPRRKFQTVGVSTDPVAVRTLVFGKRRYLYVVNRRGAAVKVTIRFKAPPRGVTSLNSGRKAAAGKRWVLKLAPYELKGFTLAPAASPLGFEAATDGRGAEPAAIS